LRDWRPETLPTRQCARTIIRRAVGSILPTTAGTRHGVRPFGVVVVVGAVVVGAVVVGSVVVAVVVELVATAPLTPYRLRVLLRNRFSAGRNVRRGP
jgi:hypothetical protein